MMELLQIGTRIINIDETWVNETSFIRKTWAPRQGQGNVILNSVTPRLSMIAAIDTDGQIWFTLSQANTDSNMMTLFIKSLVDILSEQDQGFKENTVFMFDNASYHTSQETRSAFSVMGLRVIYSGPYSYQAAPIELLFGGLKNKELNPSREPTGKK